MELSHIKQFKEEWNTNILWILFTLLLIVIWIDMDNIESSS